MSESERKEAANDSYDRDVAYFGRITASVTHELNNVISIIDQSAGLLGDLVAGEERGVPISTDRLVDISGSVRKQTQRGLQLVHRLNRFAHSTDHEYTSFDFGEEVGNLLELSRRLARLQRVELDYQPPQSGVTFSGNPFAVLKAISSVIALAVGSVRRESVITIEINPGPVVIFSGECDSQQEGSGRGKGDLQQVLAEAGATLQTDSDANMLRIRLAFAEAG